MTPPISRRKSYLRYITEVENSNLTQLLAQAAKWWPLTMDQVFLTQSVGVQTLAHDVSFEPFRSPRRLAK